MHGNAPHSGRAAPTPSAEDRRALRRELVDIASSTRALLADDFIVGGEIAGDGGLQARIAVQPPVGSVVSAGFELGDDEVDSLASELAAGAVLEAKHAGSDHPRGAR